jgi:hypothetical protein
MVSLPSLVSLPGPRSGGYRAADPRAKIGGILVPALPGGGLAEFCDRLTRHVSSSPGERLEINGKRGTPGQPRISFHSRDEQDQPASEVVRQKQLEAENAALRKEVQHLQSAHDVCSDVVTLCRDKQK